MGVLYRRHATACTERAFRVLGDRELAEDAVQEAFLDLWRHAARFDARRAPLRAWLCVLAHRRAVDIVRRETRRRLATGDLSGVEPDSYTAEELIVLAADARAIRDAVAALPPTQREVVELAYFVGLSQSEVASRLGVPLGTIKSRTHTALARLAALVQPPVAVD